MKIRDGDAENLKTSFSEDISLSISNNNSIQTKAPYLLLVDSEMECGMDSAQFIQM